MALTKATIGVGGTGGTTAATARSNLGLDTGDSPTFAGATFNGTVTNNSQPAFLATAALQSNATGDGTNYTLTFTTEVFDQGSDFDGTSTFTAPVTGKYQFNVLISIYGLTSSHTLGRLSLTTSNKLYYLSNLDAWSVSDPGGNLIISGSILADMDAADTAVVKIFVDNGTKVVDVDANYTNFSGCLVC